MFRSILVATDLLDSCDAHVHTAINIAIKNSAKLTILHLCESPTHGKYRNFIRHFKTGEEIVNDHEYERSVEKTIQEICSKALGDYKSYEIIVRPGFPWEEILRCARKKQADLVVLGPHTNRAKDMGVVRSDGSLNSTADGVIMHERYPVLISNQFVPVDRLNFRKIMVCIDFAESCRLACRAAIKLAQENDAKLYIFHMLPSSFINEDLEGKAETIDAQLKILSKEIPEGVDFEHVIREGSLPYMEILKFASEQDIYLIAMGSHLREKTKRWYESSAVEQVSSRANCPVMVISNQRALQQLVNC